MAGLVAGPAVEPRYSAIAPSPLVAPGMPTPMSPYPSPLVSPTATASPKSPPKKDVVDSVYSGRPSMPGPPRKISTSPPGFSELPPGMPMARSL